MVFALKPRSPPVAAAPKLAHGETVVVGGVAIRLKVNPRARRVSLRLDPVSREVVATAPSARRLKDAAAFAGERLGWITAQIAAIPIPPSLKSGDTIEVLGRPCRLRSVDRRADAGLLDGPDGLELCALGEGDIFVTRALRLLKRHALEVLTERSRIHAEALGRPMPSVAIMDAKSRWGSCKPPRAGTAGDLRYSWRLVLAPLWIADYVAAHECAHLLEANHGPKFWAHVHRLVGTEREARLWLRAHGARLQAMGR